jgi:hypothetical protein
MERNSVILLKFGFLNRGENAKAGPFSKNYFLNLKIWRLKLLKGKVRIFKRSPHIVGVSPLNTP